MSDNYTNHPWKGSVVDTNTFELGHDLNAKLTALIHRIVHAIERLQTIFEELSLEWKTSHSAIIA